MPHMFRFVADPILGVPGVSLIAADVVETGVTSDDASSRLSMVIAGLVVLAVVIAISTIVFWRATRPDRTRGGEASIRWVESNEVTPSSPWTATPSTPTTPTTTASEPAPKLPERPVPARPDLSASSPGAIRATPADG